MKKISSLITTAFVFTLGLITSVFSASENNTYIKGYGEPINATGQEQIKTNILKYDNLTNTTRTKPKIKSDDLKVQSLTIESGKFDNLQNKTLTGTDIKWENLKVEDLENR